METQQGAWQTSTEMLRATLMKFPTQTTQRTRTSRMISTRWTTSLKTLGIPAIPKTRSKTTLKTRRIPMETWMTTVSP